MGREFWISRLMVNSLSSTQQPHTQLLDFISFFPDVYYYVGSLQQVHNPRLTILVSRASIIVNMQTSVVQGDDEDDDFSDAAAVIAISRAIRWVLGVWGLGVWREMRSCDGLSTQSTAGSRKSRFSASCRTGATCDSSATRPRNRTREACTILVGLGEDAVWTTSTIPTPLLHPL